MFFPPSCDHPCHWWAAVGVIRQWQAKRGVTVLTDHSSCYVIVNPQPSARSHCCFHPSILHEGDRGINMMPSYFYISKRSQAAVFSLSGEGFYSTQLRARTFQMGTSQRLHGVGSLTVPVTGSLDQSQSRSQENSHLKGAASSLAADHPRGLIPLAFGAA